MKSAAKAGLWLYGKHVVLAALANKNRVCQQLLVTKDHYDEFAKLAGSRHNLNIELATPDAINRMLPRDAVHQNVALKALPLPEYHITDLLDQKNSNSCVLILDQITDPHNVGAILRSCAAFNAAALITTVNNSPQESGVLAKAASGALEIVPIIHVVNLKSTMNELKQHGYWLVGLDGKASQTISEIKFADKTALIMGAEDKGMRRLTEENCDFLAKLPINSHIESLNVSNAAAIALYEYQRKRYESMT